MELDVVTRLSTLGHPQRLALFRLLMRRYPDHVPATELAQALGVKANTLSNYLNALRAAGLIRQDRVATSLRYVIDMAVARETIDYLLLDCCRGRPEVCALPVQGAYQGDPSMKAREFNVLFICSGNSARSIFAESILRDMSGDRFTAYSAGTRPGSELNPCTLDVLRQKGHDVSGLWSKDISEFQGPDAPDFDFVFTVCNQAANEECPAWHGQPVSGHWGLPDPVAVAGTDAEKSLAFHQAYGALRNRMAAFVALPFASLDRLSLQKAVDEIGQT